MKKLFFVFAIALALSSGASTGGQNSEAQRWAQQARNVTIIRAQGAH